MNKAPARLDLDFRFARSASWIGALLLAMALGFAADLGYSYLQVSEASAHKQARLAQLSQALSRSGDSAARLHAASRNASPEEVKAARESLRQLSMPWSRLFQALESAGGRHAQQIALLALEPDPESGSVRISGEGKDYLAVLNYVLELRRAGTLADVALVHHEVNDAVAREANGSRRVAFSISASWGEAKQ